MTAKEKIKLEFSSDFSLSLMCLILRVLSKVASLSFLIDEGTYIFMIIKNRHRRNVG